MVHGVQVRIPYWPCMVFQFGTEPKRWIQSKWTIVTICFVTIKELSNEYYLRMNDGYFKVHYQVLIGETRKPCLALSWHPSIAMLRSKNLHATWSSLCCLVKNRWRFRVIKVRLRYVCLSRACRGLVLCHSNRLEFVACWFYNHFCWGLVFERKYFEEVFYNEQ